MAETVIKVTDLHKKFRIPHEKYTSLKQNAIHLFSQRSFSEFDAVKNVAFEVKKGEFFGIVGRNGSGKSTLLKMLAGIYVPTSGLIEVKGKLSPFIELGVGFNPELSARDNVFLNGAILGLNRQQIEERFDDIISFAELEEFVDQRLKNFSSGMQVRLAFSIAIQAESDILLIDEVLAVGDANFQAKCFNVFKQLKKKGKTIVFVSHDMDSVKNFCDRAILIHEGELRFSGGVDYIVNQYNKLNFAEPGKSESSFDPTIDSTKRWGNGDIQITDVAAYGKRGKQTIFEPKELVNIRVEAKATKSVPHPIAGVIMKAADGTRVFVTNSKLKDTPLPTFKKGEVFSINFEIDNVFSDGKYDFSPAFASADARMFYDWIEGAIEVEIRGGEAPTGLCSQNTK